MAETNDIVADNKKEEIAAKVDAEEKPSEVPDEEKTEDDDDDDEDGSSSEEELGLLEKPVEIMDGVKRERKSTERLSFVKEEKKVEELDYSKGKGVALGDIEYVRWEIDTNLADDLEPLHRLLYSRGRKKMMIKRNIRTFCGYPFEKDHKKYIAASYLLERFTVPGLKFIRRVLGMEGTPTKAEMMTEIMDFLMEPKDLGKKIPEKKTPAKKKPKQKKKKTDSAKKSSPKKKVSKKKSASEVSEASDSDADDEDEAPKKKTASPKKAKKDEKEKKKTPVKIALGSKKKKEGEKETKKKTPKKTPKKEAKRKADSDTEDDEPLVKKKKSEPTNDEVRKVIKDILRDADLEQVTMKTVCKQVYDHFPDFDMTVRKEFIKNTVKEIIS